MLFKRRPWREELEIIDRTMKAISSITDPEELVETYWTGIGELIPIHDYVSISRRDITPPEYLITRSSRFEENINPWTQRHRLPRMQGGLLGEIAYANRPVIMEDVPARLREDDPAHRYLKGFQSLVALPHYDSGEGINVTVMLMPAEMQIDNAIIPVLHWQSGLFGRGTQNLVLRNELASALKTLDRELQTVGEIQRSLLPKDLPKIPGFDLAAYYHTSARAGGDYYDFFPLGDDKWGIFIADVSGHGTPAAVLMAITHAIAHTQPGTHTPPVELLHYLNEQLAQSYTQNGTFVTAFYAVLDAASRTLKYSKAGHNPPRLVRGERIIALDESNALPLGILAGEEYSQATVMLQPGDLLLLYTDGITEAMAPLTKSGSRELFGVDRLDTLLLSRDERDAKGCIRAIQSSLSEFCQTAALSDDQTLIAVRTL